MFRGTLTFLCGFAICLDTCAIRFGCQERGIVLFAWWLVEVPTDGLCMLCAGVLHVCTFCFWLISVFGQMLFPVEFAHSAYLRMYVFVSRLCSRCNMTSRKGFRALTVWCLWVEWLFAGETRLDSLQVSVIMLLGVLLAVAIWLVVELFRCVF
eukprot:gene13005-8851_t